MRDFVVIDFETGNPKRVSACAIGYAKVSDCCNIVDSKGYLIKPIGGHAPFQSKIHGIKQVLNALSEHFNLGLKFDYIDSINLAKEKCPNLKNYKLKTLVKYLNLPPFKHHDAVEDAIACANIFLKLQDHVTEEVLPEIGNEIFEFKGLVSGIIADEKWIIKRLTLFFTGLRIILILR